jgi:predicted RNA-binding protein with PIN domain
MAWLLIDGHNVIFHTGTLARQYKKQAAPILQRLIRLAEKISDIRPWKVVLVFDGNKTHTSHTYTSSTIEIIFSAIHQSADALIEILTKKIPPTEEIYIVTADQGLAHTTYSPRTYILSPEWFLDECQSAQNLLTARLHYISQKAQW